MLAGRLSSTAASTSGRRTALSSCRPSLRSRRVCVGAQALLKEGDGVSASWSQTTDDVLIRVPVEEGVRGRDIGFEVHPKRLSLKLKGEPLLEGGLADAGSINADDSFWSMEEDGNGKYVLITLAKKNMGYESWEMLLQSEKVEAVITDRAFLQLSIDGQPAGKMVIGLYGSVVPKTVENFKALMTGEKGDGVSSKPLHYKGSKFHRIIGGFMAQGGDFTTGNGFGGESIFGEKFEDENFKLRHDERGVVAMANAGPNTNGSQFYIAFDKLGHLDGKHVVFGKVEVGMDILGRMEAVGSDSGTPSAEVEVTDCGLVGADEDLESIMDENKQLAMSKE